MVGINCDSKFRESLVPGTAVLNGAWKIKKIKTSFSRVLLQMRIYRTCCLSRKRGVERDRVFMCMLTSRQVLHLYMTVYSIHSTARHANLSLSLVHPGRSEGLPDKQNYIEIFRSSQRLDQGVNVQCLGVQDEEQDAGEEEGKEDDS